MDGVLKTIFFRQEATIPLMLIDCLAVIFLFRLERNLKVNKASQVAEANAQSTETKKINKRKAKKKER